MSSAARKPAARGSRDRPLCGCRARPRKDIGRSVWRKRCCLTAFPLSSILSCGAIRSAPLGDRNRSRLDRPGTLRYAPGGCQALKRAWRAALTAPNARCTRATRTAPGRRVFSRRPRPTVAARHQRARIPTSPTLRLLPPSLRRFSASGLSCPPTSLLSF